jgi:sugar/nucleoside kinase (ribokinase family)
MHLFESTSVSRVCDPTGAGDVFFACYLSERIVQKQSVSAAVCAAARLAAEQVSGTFLAANTLGLHR